MTAVGGLLFFFNLFYSLKKGAVASADPWDGRTLEWSIPSPPPEYNFGIEPEVKVLDDFWAQKYDDKGTKKPLPAAPKYDPKAIHMPNPSYWPIALAAGITLGAAGFFLRDIGLYVSLLGVAVILISSYGWAYEEA